MYICGDGVRGTAEDCDDGNTDNGNGCSVSCVVESGYVCTGVVNQQSQCLVPVAPTIQWEAASYGPFKEGAVATLTVLRFGDDVDEVSVDFRTNDATAKRYLVDNSAFAPNTLQTAGDYLPNNGTLVFGVRVSALTIDIQILEDGNWDSAVDDKLAVLLENPAGGGSSIGSINICYVSIDDDDSMISSSATQSPTESPTLAPTASPP